MRRSLTADDLADVRDEDRDGLRVQLERAILIVLRRHPALHYFQGYHDVRLFSLSFLASLESPG